jgi:hypothetical protein
MVTAVLKSSFKKKSVIIQSEVYEALLMRCWSQVLIAVSDQPTEDAPNLNDFGKLES